MERWAWSGRVGLAARLVVGSLPSREFEIASRDFLRVEAAQGDVVVEYRPFHLADGRPFNLRPGTELADQVQRTILED